MKCNLCGSVRNSVFVSGIYEFDSRNYCLMRCEDCGLVFVKPLPSLSERKKMYSEKYFEENKVSGFRERGYKDDKEFYAERYKLILNRLKGIRGGGRLLEVGSAGGYFLNMARSSGYCVRGVEISKWAADFSRKKFGVDVFVGEVSDAGFKSGSFDVVVAGNVLEHVDDPMSFVREVNRVLAPGGIFVVEVPYFINSPYFRVARFVFGRVFKVGRRNKEFLEFMKINRYGPISPPYHIYEFSISTIKRGLAVNGFDILRIDSSFPDAALKHSLFVNAFLFCFSKLVSFLMGVFRINFCNVTVYARKR